MFWLENFFFGILNWDRNICWMVFWCCFCSCKGFNLFRIVGKWFSFIGGMGFGLFKDIGGSIVIYNFLGLVMVYLFVWGICNILVFLCVVYGFIG